MAPPVSLLIGDALWIIYSNVPFPVGHFFSVFP